jgi:hypothetical protein
MKTTEVHIELLLGRRVVARNGKFIGRIEEIRAEPRGSKCLVEEYLLGSFAILERFSAWAIGRAILRAFGPFFARAGYRVRWDQLDLSDPDRPRLTCNVAELEPLN